MVGALRAGATGRKARSYGEGRLSERDRTGRIDSRTVYRGRVFDVHLDRVRLPDGSVGELEVLRHPGAAAVLPVFRAGERPGRAGPTVVLLRQYRYAADGEIWEVPAGRLEEGESPPACARRELEEEAGLRARQLRALAAIYTTPGFTDERIHLFLATGLERGEAQRERSEFIQTRELSLGTAVEMVRSGEIEDSKTVCALLHAVVYDEQLKAASGGV